MKYMEIVEFLGGHEAYWDMRDKVMNTFPGITYLGQSTKNGRYYVGVKGDTTTHVGGECYEECWLNIATDPHKGVKL